MFTLNCNGKPLLIDKPLVMGVVNITSDSFYSGSRYDSSTSALVAALMMLDEGAAIIDVGGQSTRPASHLLTAKEEAKAVIPFIKMLKDRRPDVLISVDTFYAEVAYQAVMAGAAMVNDISGGGMDENMITAVAGLGVPYIGMHMKGTPQTMQQQTQYDHLLTDITDYFIKLIERCTAAGMNDLILDPGFGFAKNTDQNFKLLRSLSCFQFLGKPLLVGVSRKSMVYKTLATTPEAALNGTTVLNTVALLNGANILRVHDVKEAVECVTLVSACRA